jgi:glutamate/tyrosine decarboxylase-like PLP-dependent enzyme
MDISILEKEIKNNIKEGNEIFFVSATAWTTVRWAYDNIEKILELKEKYWFWLHVDWAWWWVAFLNEKLKKKFLSWIEKVDSFTFDFHKLPWISLMCNMFLLKNKWNLKKSCSIWNTNYIFSENNNRENLTNLWENSLTCWKKVDSLKLFLEWKYNWKKWISDKIQFYYDLIKYTETLILKFPKLEIVFPRVSFNLCFRYITPKNIDSNNFNLKLRTLINKSWKSMIWWAYVDNKYVIRLVVSNEKLKKEDLNILLNNIINKAEEMLKKLI